MSRAVCGDRRQLAATVVGRGGVRDVADTITRAGLPQSASHRDTRMSPEFRCPRGIGVDRIEPARDGAAGEGATRCGLFATAWYVVSGCAAVIAGLGALPVGEVAIFAAAIAVGLIPCFAFLRTIDWRDGV